MTDPKTLHLLRQWFTALQDVNPRYLEDEDYQLAKRIYEQLGIRVPHSIQRRLDAKADS